MTIRMRSRSSCRKWDIYWSVPSEYKGPFRSHPTAQARWGPRSHPTAQARWGPRWKRRPEHRGHSARREEIVLESQTIRARRIEAEQSLDELAGLADAAGAEVVLRMLQERPKPDPATFIGSGKVASLAAACAEADVDVVIFDNELTPAQLRQLEEKL